MAKRNRSEAGAPPAARKSSKQKLASPQEGSSGTAAPFPFGAPKRLADGGIKTTLVQRVHQTLLEGFDEGIFRPGQRIKAAELAKRLGLSRAPVREALHVLAGQGIVELRPDMGAVMRALNLADLVQIYEITGPIASVGVAAATKRIHERDNAERVRLALEKIKAASREPPSYKFYLALNDFHYLLNQIGEKPYVDFLLGILNIEYWNRFLAGTIDLKRHMPGYVRNYVRLADSILAGDSRSAEAIMRSHVEWSISLLLESSAANSQRDPSKSVDI